MQRKAEGLKKNNGFFSPNGAKSRLLFKIIFVWGIVFPYANRKYIFC
jgi:hypothetical protein